MATVSIIVPVYNVEQYLNRCIESILSQTFTDFELILVDDGSPDNCPAICDEYAAKDSRIKVIHKENGGVSAARNTALDTAAGEYIAFCDSDDWWEPSYLCQLFLALTTENADIVAANYISVDETGVAKQQSNHPAECREISQLSEKWNFIINDILGGRHGWEVWTRLFRGDLIREHKIRFCETCGNYGEDLGFVLEVALHARKACSITFCGYHYQLRSDSMMRTSQPVVKLDQMNEVSKYVAQSFSLVFGVWEMKQKYPIIHFILMYFELRKLVGTERYCELCNELKKIRNFDWFRYQMKHVLKCKNEIAHLYSKRIAQQIVLLSHYCLHGNWRRFQYECAIAYRWFIKGA